MTMHSSRGEFNGDRTGVLEEFVRLGNGNANRGRLGHYFLFLLICGFWVFAFEISSYVYVISLFGGSAGFVYTPCRFFVIEIVM